VNNPGGARLLGVDRQPPRRWVNPGGRRPWLLSCRPPGTNQTTRQGYWIKRFLKAGAQLTNVQVPPSSKLEMRNSVIRNGNSHVKPK
jgi:hypothetical protein